MKTHPGPTVFHIIFKSLTLNGIFRTSIQKNYYLIL